MVRSNVLLFVCVYACLFATGGAQADADSARNMGEAWLIEHQRGDGSWVNANGDLSVQATSAAILALKNGGLSKSPTFGSASAWLANADADSVDSIARKTEALVAAGMSGSAQAEADRLYSLRTLGNSSTWGGYGGNGVDYLDTALGLTALRVGDAAYGSKAAAAAASNSLLGAFCELATSRISVAVGKQAWPATKAATNQSAGQGRPSVVVTALLLNELRSMRLAVSTSFSSATCSSTAYSFVTLESEAQAWLLDQQNSDGGFGEQRTDGSKGASNVLVTALMYRALNSQASPPQPQTANAQSWLLAQQDSASGSWHNDPLVTAQVLSVLPAAAGAQLTDTSHDGIPDVVAVQLGSDPNLADARNYIGNPTLATPGLNSTAFAAGATTGQLFTYTLSGSGSYSLVSGSLPPGLTMDPTGQISGTPTQSGSYSFDYQSSDSFVVGRIDVVDPVSAGGNDGDVPLPGWAMAMLGAALLGTMLHKRGATTN